MSINFIYRPALFAGLLFFLGSDHPVWSAEFPSYSSYKSTPVSDVPDLLDLPDTSQIIASSEYDPILFELKDSASDTYNTRVHSSNSQIGFFRHDPRYDFFIIGRYSGFSGKLHDDNFAYAIENNQQNGEIISGLSYHTNRLSLSGAIGRMFAESVKREHWSTITDSAGEYLSKSPWLVACAAKVVLKSISLHVGAFSGPVHSSISKIVNSESGSYRHFPVYLLKRNLQAGIEGTFPWTHFNIDIGFDILRTADMITTSNAMPQDIEVNTYKVQGKLWLKTLLTDSLFLNVNYSIAGGAIASYNFSRERMTMFESSVMKIRNGNVLAGLSLPRGFIAGIAAARAHLTMLSGYLRLSAFSNWSVFRPMDYRFSDASVAYTEMGLFGNRTMQYKSFDLCPEITFSYIRAKGECIYEQKKIVVMFPVYGDTVQETFINSRILCITPDLKAGIHLSKIDINCSLSQKIPIELKKRAAPNDNGEAGSSTSGKSRFYGGSTLSVSVIKCFGNVSK
jgi:hypothetical protein